MAAFALHAAVLQCDMSNYTGIEPVIDVNEVHFSVVISLFVGEPGTAIASTPRCGCRPNRRPTRPTQPPMRRVDGRSGQRVD